MSAATILANPIAVAAPTGDNGAAASTSNAADASVFASLVASEPTPEAGDTPTDAPAVAVSAPSDKLAIELSARAPRPSPLSPKVFIALQPQAEAAVDGLAEASAVTVALSDGDDIVPGGPARGGVETQPAPTIEDAGPKGADPLPAAPVVPVAIPQVVVLSAEAAVDLDVPPAQAAPPQADLPPNTDTPAPAEFGDAVANASAATSKAQQATNAAPETSAVPAPKVQSSVAAAESGLRSSETQLAAAEPPAETPSAPRANPAPLPAATAPVESAAPPTNPAPVAAAAPAPAPAAPVTLTPTTLSQISQTAVDATVQIAAQITRKLDGRQTRFEMGLTPEGLGRVDVSLDIDSGGRLTARLAFDNPLAATELRGKADELRRELQDAGFIIAHDGLDFSERQPSSSNGGFDRQSGRAFANASRITTDADLAQPPPAAWMSLSLTPTGVDMKV